MRCHNCRKGTLVPAIAPESVVVAGHTFRGDVPVLRCPECDEFVYPAEVVGRFELAVGRALAEAGARSGEAFRFLRKALGLRAVDLAELLDVAPETVSRWETGARDVDRVAFALLGSAVIERLEGRARTLDLLRAVAEPHKLAKTVRVDIADRPVAA